MDVYQKPESLLEYLKNKSATRQSNALSWTLRTSGTSNDLNKVIYANNMFVAVGGIQPNAVILTSQDGTNWTSGNISQGFVLGFNGIAYGGGTFVAVGNTTGPSGTYIATSKDGQNWSFQGNATATGYTLNDIVYGNGIFIAVGNNKVVTYSNDAITWKSGTLGTNSGNNFNVTNVRYDSANKIFYALASLNSQNNDGTFSVSTDILSSSDGTKWTSILPNATPLSFFLPISGAEYINGIYYGLGISSTIWAFPDLSGKTTGTKVYNETGKSQALYSMAYGNGYYAAVGFPSQIKISTNGNSWSAADLEGSDFYNSIAFGNNTFVIVGSGGIIYQSAAVSSPSPTPSPSASPVKVTITANNQTNTLNVSSTQTVTITLSLDPGGSNGTNADWWVARNTSQGLQYYVYPGTWQTASSLAQLKPAYQGALMTLSNFTLLSTVFQAGQYTYYFGIDTNMNGTLDTDKLTYSYIILNVSP